MKPLVCIYCEGNDTKLAVISNEKEHITILRAGSFDAAARGFESSDDDFSSLSLDSDISVTEAETFRGPRATNSASTNVALINSVLRGLNLSNHFFIPGLTEPSVYFHVFEGVKGGRNAKITQEIVSDIKENKNINIDRENVGYIELADKTLFSVVLSDDVPCFRMINTIAQSNGKRFYKIPAVKSAELSLAYYTAKRKKFFPDDNSLIVYIGKEYSKLIFLQGRKLKHIGSTLDIGTINLHTYDVYFSKILLEMENGGINTLDNIVVCGEDDSENLILSFYGTFPEANVSRLDFDDVDFSGLDPKSIESISSFSVPIAIAIEYYDELAGLTKGINLLPKYLIDEQKVFQWAWHGYAMLPILFAAAFFITLQVLKYNKEISHLDGQILEKQELIRQNQQVVNKINELESKISSFDQTKIILDSASTGAGVWNKALMNISGFFGFHKNIWLTTAKAENASQMIVEGYAINKNVLTAFAAKFKKAEIKSIIAEQLKETTLYKFSIIIDLAEYKYKLLNES